MLNFQDESATTTVHAPSLKGWFGCQSFSSSFANGPPVTIPTGTTLAYRSSQVATVLYALLTRNRSVRVNIKDCSSRALFSYVASQDAVVNRDKTLLIWSSSHSSQAFDLHHLISIKARNHVLCIHHPCHDYLPPCLRAVLSEY